MLRLFLATLIITTGSAAMVSLYLLVRSYHRQWWWQDQVNQNAMRRAILEEADIQFEVAPDGFVRPVRRSERGHEQRAGLG